MKETVGGEELEWSPLTKEETEHLVSNHALIYGKSGCSLGFSLSSTLYCSAQPQKKKRERKRGEGKGDKEWTFVTLMTTVITVVPISNDINFFRGRTLYSYIEMSTMAFRDTRIFISLSWTLINDLCSLRLWGFMLWVYKSYKLISIHQAETPLNLTFHFHSQRVHTYEYPCQGSTALSLIHLIMEECQNLS